MFIHRYLYIPIWKVDFFVRYLLQGKTVLDIQCGLDLCAILFSIDVFTFHIRSVSLSSFIPEFPFPTSGIPFYVGWWWFSFYMIFGKILVFDIFEVIGPIVMKLGGYAKDDRWIQNILLLGQKVNVIGVKGQKSIYPRSLVRLWWNLASIIHGSPSRHVNMAQGHLAGLARPIRKFH